MKKPLNIKKRKRARQYLVQALYQWELNKTSSLDIEVHFQESLDMSRIDREYFSTVLQGVINDMLIIDETIKKELDRDISELTPVELSVLRLATYELIKQDEIPFKVIINEALDLSKLFGSQEGHKYVNGVLEAIVKKVRPFENINLRNEEKK